MRILFQTFIFALALSLSGCGLVFEDDLDCLVVDDHNVVFHFTNIDDEGNEIFSTTITRVELFIFDENNTLAYRQMADDAEIAKSKTTTMSINPGRYRIVAIANISDNELISMEKGDAISNGYVYQQIQNPNRIENGAPLYYAPYNLLEPQMFTVTEDQRQDVQVRFRAAHIKMDFRVVGYSTVTGETSLPYVEITSLYPRYDFLMNHQPTPALSYIQQTSTTARATDVSYVKFNAPRFLNDNDIVINIRRDLQSPPLKSLMLRDALVLTGIDLSNRVEVTLPFEIVFTNNGSEQQISIELTDWHPNPIDPDINKNTI